MFAILVAAIVLTVIGLVYYFMRRNATKGSSSIQARNKNMSNTFLVRHAGIDDIAIIRSLALETWPSTYSQILSPQQVVLLLNKKYSEVALHQQMHDKHRFLLIYSSTKPIGFAAYSEIQTSIFKLHKLYVLPEQQGLGAGRFILEKIVEEVKAKKGTTLLLNVNKHNPAKGFYERLGFAVSKAVNVPIGDGNYMNDFIMELPLQKQVLNSTDKTATTHQ